MPGNFSVSQIDHVELYVPDRAVAADWYERVLGLKPFGKAASWADNPHGPLMISPDAGRTMVALFTGPPQGKAEAVGLCRLAFRVDARGFLEFTTNGVVDVEVKDHGMAFSAYFTDPWGTPLEVTTYEAGQVRAGLTV
jgi:catechol 2,3-dioxygenase-like lactoylglutathione lyase family enzyme